MGTAAEEYNASVATVIRSERAIRMMTLRDLSEKTGIATTNLLRIEKGERDIKLTDLWAIADAFEMDAQEMLKKAQS